MFRNLLLLAGAAPLFLACNNTAHAPEAQQVSAVTQSGTTASDPPETETPSTQFTSSDLPDSGIMGDVSDAGVITDASAPTQRRQLSLSASSFKVHLSEVQTLGGHTGLPTALEIVGPCDACALGFIQSPEVSPNPNPAVPLAAVLSLETNLAARVEVLVTGGGEEWTLTLDESDTRHTKPILGMKPDTEYQFTVTAFAHGKELLSEPIAYHTPPLPVDFPPLVLSESMTEQMEPGMTLFNVRLPQGAYLVVVDAMGEVRWYYKGAHHSPRDDHGVFSNGHIVFGEYHQRIVEMDWLGNVIQSWQAVNSPEPKALGDSIPVDADSFHHEFYEMPTGNILTLSSEATRVEGFPTSTSDPDAPTETGFVVSCVILELSPDGEVAKRISILDLLDPTRVGMGSLGGYWSEYDPSARDWGHSNSVVYDPEDDAYIVSVRHQDAIIKVDRETESLVWILGTPSNWKAPWADKLLTPIGDLKWPYHQHAVDFTPHGIGAYDNGTYRASAFETPTLPYYSRAVEFAIDEQAMTVRQVWSYGDGEGDRTFFSDHMSDADWLPQTGNVLIASASLRSKVVPGYVYAQMLEVTPEGELVWELNITGEPDPDATPYHLYRADRIADIRQ